MRLRTALPALLCVLLSLLVSAPARATPGWYCPGVCHLVTCDSSACSLWRCDREGCTVLASWASDGLPPLELAGDRRAPRDRRGEVRHAAVCPPREDCRLWELDARGALLLGRFDNLDDVVRERRDLATSPRG